MGVTFWEHTKGKKRIPRKDRACFYEMGNHGSPIPETIVYRADLRNHNALTNEMVETFINFLSLVLMGERFTADFQRGKQRVVWRMDCKDLNRIQILLHLTAFRYLDEYAKHVKSLYEFSQKLKPQKTPELWLEELWKFFYLDHSMDGGTGHNLLHRSANKSSWVGAPSAIDPPPLVEFQAMLRSGKGKTVFETFNSLK